MFMYILLAFFITIYKTIVIFLQQLWNKHCVHLCFIKFFASKVASIFSFRIWFYFRCILLYLFRCHDFLAFSLFIDVVFFYGFFLWLLFAIYQRAWEQISNSTTDTIKWNVDTRTYSFPIWSQEHLRLCRLPFWSISDSHLLTPSFSFSYLSELRPFV